MENLKFLEGCDEEELEVLADILREKGGFSSMLSERNDYESKEEYAWAIADELLDYGSNTLLGQEDYGTVLRDVCDKMDVATGGTIEEVEARLLASVSSNLWEKASEEGRRALLEAMDENAVIAPQAAAAFFAGVFRAGGFASYQLSVIVANSLARLVVGRGLSLGVNAVLARALSFISGPLGLLMGAWAIFQITGPAYRVTVPAVTYVAALRQMQRNRQFAKE